MILKQLSRRAADYQLENWSGSGHRIGVPPRQSKDPRFWSKKCCLCPRCHARPSARENLLTRDVLPVGICRHLENVVGRSPLNWTVKSALFQLSCRGLRVGLLKRVLVSQYSGISQTRFQPISVNANETARRSEEVCLPFPLVSILGLTIRLSNSSVDS